MEDGEHQRDGRQRLLAARQQVDGAVLLARRLRHHLHAGVQDLVARHHQLGVAAAEQAGEHAAEVLVDLVEGLAQQVAGLEVDLVDRVFQRLDGLVQVGVLRVEEGLALARAVSSSSAARLTAPSALISRWMRSISPAGPRA
jgi:hypothetical protein